MHEKHVACVCGCAMCGVCCALAALFRVRVRRKASTQKAEGGIAVFFGGSSPWGRQRRGGGRCFLLPGVTDQAPHLLALELNKHMCSMRCQRKPQKVRKVAHTEKAGQRPRMRRLLPGQWLLGPTERTSARRTTGGLSLVCAQAPNRVGAPNPHQKLAIEVLYQPGLA